MSSDAEILAPRLAPGAAEPWVTFALAFLLMVGQPAGRGHRSEEITV